MIQKRASRLDRVEHRRNIDLREDVVGEKGLELVVEKTRELVPFGVGRPAGFEDFFIRSCTQWLPAQPLPHGAGRETRGQTRRGHLAGLQQAIELSSGKRSAAASANGPQPDVQPAAREPQWSEAVSLQ